MSGRPLAVLVAAAAGVAGCGGSAGSADEPGTIVPRSAYLYIEANLDPDGKQEDAVRTLLASLPGVGDPSQRLQEQFNAYAKRRYGVHAAEFDRDIKPWLGSRMAGFSLLPPHGTDPDRAPSGLIAAARDAEKARHWLFVVSRRKDERERVYKGVRYLLDRGRQPTASAVVEDFVLAADPAAFKAVVDRRQRLAGQKRFASAAKRAEPGALGVVWYDTHRLVDALARRVGGSYLRAALPAIRRLIPSDPL